MEGGDGVSCCRPAEKPELRVLCIPESGCQRVPAPAGSPASFPSLPYFPFVSAPRFVPAKIGLYFQKRFFSSSRTDPSSSQTGSSGPRPWKGWRRGSVLLSSLMVGGGGGSTTPALWERKLGPPKGKATHREQQGRLGLHLRNSPK